MSKSILIINMCIFLRVTDVFSQALTATDGEMHNLLPGHTYTLEPIPSSDTSISPIIGGAEWGEPMTFVLNAPAGTKYRVSFVLTGNESLCGGTISSSLSTNALRWEEENERLDPTNPQTVTADSSGKATLHLGIRLTIQSNTKRHYYSARVNCLIVSMQIGDSLFASAALVAFLYGDLYLPGIQGEMKNLSGGYTYSLTPYATPSPITPLINGREEGTLAQLQNDVAPGATVQVVFTLPAYLIGDQNYDRIPCRFPSDAVFLEEAGKRMDPHLLDTIALGSSCSLTLDMGITVSIPSDAVTGWYGGFVIVEASYIGNVKSIPSDGVRAELELLFAVQVTDYNIPKTVSLLQNYPNPFNSSTTITYGLPEPTSVSLEIFDLLGREIATLIRGYQYAGWHKIDWKADDVASASYIYKLTAGNFTRLKKVLLVR